MHYRKQIYHGQNGEVYLSMSGELSAGLARIHAPAADEIRAMLFELRRRQKWSRATLAAILGISRDVVRSWESGVRQPSASAKKLVWMVFKLVTQPRDLLNGLDSLVTWGRTRENRDECVASDAQSSSERPHAISP